MCNSIFFYILLYFLEAWGKHSGLTVLNKPQTFTVNKHFCFMLHPDVFFCFVFFVIIPFNHIMIQAVICRLLESIRGLNESRLDWGLYFKIQGTAPAPPATAAPPLIFQCSATNGDAPFQIFIWCQTWKRHDGALYVVSWSCRRAGARAVTCLTWWPNKIYSSCVTRRAPDLGPLLLPLPRWLTQPDTYCPPRFIIINTPTIRGMFFLFCFFQTNPKKLFPKRWHKLAFGWDENLLIVKHIQGSFPECLAQRVGREAAAHIHFPHLHLQTVCCVVWPELFLGTKKKNKKHTFLLPGMRTVTKAWSQ